MVRIYTAWCNHSKHHYPDSSKFKRVKISLVLGMSYSLLKVCNSLTEEWNSQIKKLKIFTLLQENCTAFKVKFGLLEWFYVWQVTVSGHWWPVHSFYRLFPRSDTLFTELFSLKTINFYKRLTSDCTIIIWYCGEYATSWLLDHAWFSHCNPLTLFCDHFDLF